MAIDPRITFCTECGTPLPVNSLFCIQCGAQVDTSATQHPDAAPPADPVVISEPTVASTGGGSRYWLGIAVGALGALVIAGIGAWMILPRLQQQQPLPAVSSAPPQTAQVAQPGEASQPDLEEDAFSQWFEAQDWYQRFSSGLPKGVTWGFHVFDDEEHPGETLVEVREFHAPDSDYDPNVSPMVGQFRVSADRLRVLWLNVLEDGWQPVERFVASREPTAASAVAAVDAPPTPAIVSKETPVALVYRTFVDEAFRSRGGKMKVGSPHLTDHRIDNTITVEGETLAYVFVEIANDGQKAEVLVGPQDAGADRTYQLHHSGDGWVITGYEKGEFE